ncbi:Carotenoid 3,4-desaturase [uncultured archaeon]|nr:Carotenoid 3,4-desaturase [uncultured archaeon]
MESTDIIIIGAGVGGLSAAAYLAQAGRKVVVLEQEHHIGGTAHVFERGGFVFPTGPKSVTMPAHILDYLCELGVEELPCFARDSFQVRRGAMDVMISAPLHEIKEQLLEFFPGEQDGILTVFNVLEEVMATLDVIKPEDLTITTESPTLAESWDAVSAEEFMDSHLHDERLKDLLGSQGTSEPEMSVALLARMWYFMSKKGIWYPGGGICKIPELLAMRVRAFGGEIRLGERVEHIMVHRGTATGVELSGGAKIKSDHVISNADYKETIFDLLPHNSITANRQEAISRMPLTSSNFTIFLGVKSERLDLSAIRGHHLIVKLMEGKPVPWELKRPRIEDFLQDEIWLSLWSKHDPGLAPPGCEALIINVTAPFEHFASLEGSGRCHEQYHSMKEKMADALVAAASRVVPGLSRAVVVREVATPLTYKDLGHRSNGSVAGWSWRFGDHSGPMAQSLAITPVRGLLMVGMQSFTSLFYGGMGTALYSGRYAAAIVLSETCVHERDKLRGE